ncbi:hypothetical protein [Aeoliella sp. SH292]|uniref:hypothetical protein n=1 Tax=Aeoliella sp. SH292 TaxID=3454464 RepID=UPI003F973805
MTCRSLGLIVTLVVTLLAGRSISLADETGASYADQLPRDTLVAARVSQLDRFDPLVQPLAESFGVTVPPIGTLAASLEGVDPRGDVIVGIVGLGSGKVAPFVLLPVEDYRAFVRSGDGDAGVDFTPITLAGEELLAQERGRWALVINPVDDTAPFEVDSENDVEFDRPELGDSLITVLATSRGMAELKRLAASRSESPYHLANRRRMLASRPINWRSLQELEERLSLYAPLVARTCDNAKHVQLAIDVADDQSLEFEARLVPKQAKQIPAAESSLPPVTLSDQRPMLEVEGPAGSPWTDLLVDLHIDSYSAGSDEVDVIYFSPPELEKWRAGIARARDMVIAARGLVIAPAEGEPTVSNGALVLQVKSSAEFVSAFDAVMADWNSLVNTATRRNADFIYETKPLAVGSLEGKRYTVDLPTAFRQDNIPEVREVMAKMYGRNGVRALDILPLDERHVLISDLTDALRDQLIASMSAAASAPLSNSKGWTIAIEPATMQDWLNDMKLHTYGEDVVGWKPQPLDADGNVTIEVTTHEPELVVRTKVPGDVVRAVGKLSRKKS